MLIKIQIKIGFFRSYLRRIVTAGRPIPRMLAIDLVGIDVAHDEVSLEGVVPQKRPNGGFGPAVIGGGGGRVAGDEAALQGGQECVVGENTYRY